MKMVREGNKMLIMLMPFFKLDYSRICIVEKIRVLLKNQVRN